MCVCVTRIYCRVVTIVTCVSYCCVFVAYLSFCHFGAAVALLPVPDRYIVIRGLVDGA